MISFGVALGAIKAFQDSVLKPCRPCSASVGIFGAAGERFAVVTASGTRVPPSICPTASDILVNTACTSPESTAAVAGAPPRYGTCVSFTPVFALNNSAEKYINPPTPLEL